MAVSENNKGHEFMRFVYDGEWYFDGWLCPTCGKQVSIADSPDSAPRDDSDCEPAL